MRGWVVAALVVDALIISAMALRPGTAKYDEGGLSFEYPAGWTLHDKMPGMTGFGQLFAILGTATWGPCAVSDVNCHFRERLGAQQVEVEVGSLYLPTDDGLCSLALNRTDLADRTSGPAVAGTSYVRVDGRPAMRTDFVVNGADYYGSDGWQEWRIAASDSTNTLFTIEARWRGPGTDGFLAALDRMVATLHLPGPSLGKFAPDCGAPFPGT